MGTKKKYDEVRVLHVFWDWKHQRTRPTAQGATLIFQPKVAENLKMENKHHILAFSWIDTSLLIFPATAPRVYSIFVEFGRQFYSEAFRFLTQEFFI